MIAGSNTAEGAAEAAALAGGVCRVAEGVGPWEVAVGIVKLKSAWIHSSHKPGFRRDLMHRTGDK